MLSRVVERFAQLSALRDSQESLLALADLARDVADLNRATVLLPASPPSAAPWCELRRSASGGAPQLLPHDEPGLPASHGRPERLWWPLDAAALRLAFPLFVSAHRQAVLVTRRSTPLSEDELQALLALQRLFANHRSLVEENQCDSLTGLRNRKTFDEAFSRIAMAQTPKPPSGGERRAGRADGCWLGVLDIDHFKRINDNHGHLIGDEVLLMLAQLIRQTVRDSDQTYRFGGEEFVLLMKAPNAAAARRAFERLRLAVARHAFPQVGSITVSIGITAVSADDMPSDAFGRADQALYWVKQNGRNQAVDHEALVASGALKADTAATSVEFF